jgi:hypothetical protein
VSLPSYPKIYNLGHRAIRDLFAGPVAVQEKVDGSQFSFGVQQGNLFVSTKGGPREVSELLGDKLFAGATMTAVAAAERGVLKEGWVYRGEAMMGPRHNVLEYNRAPLGNLVLFDVDVGLEDRIEDIPSPNEHGEPRWLACVAHNLGCEVIPNMHYGEVSDLESMKKLTEGESFLGGRIEGLVFKNYDRFGIDGKMLMGKYVTDAFREQHKNDPNWKPKQKNDILEQVKARYRHERRWEKAIERMRDDGLLTSSPADIGPLIKGIQHDVREECADEIGQMFFNYYQKQVLGGVVAGFPEWYKERLAELQFQGIDGA